MKNYAFTLPPEKNNHTLTVNDLHAIVFVADMDTRNIRWCNDTMMEMLGYSLAEMQEMGSDLFKTLMYPDDLPDAIKAEELFLSGTCHYTASFRFRKKDSAEWHWFYGITTVYERGKEGDIKSLLCTAYLLEKTDTPEKTMMAFEQLFRSMYCHACVDLSYRQLAILQFLKKGYNARAISKELLVGYETVRAELKKLYIKFNVHSAIALVAAFVGMNL